jgi:hypothetical protein
MEIITSEKIWQVQHDVKKSSALFISTGATLRHIETPIIPTPAAIPPSARGQTPHDANGIIATNHIQNFFNVFMILIIP